MNPTRTNTRLLWEKKLGPPLDDDSIPGHNTPSSLSSWIYVADSNSPSASLIGYGNGTREDPSTDLPLDSSGDHAANFLAAGSPFTILSYESGAAGPGVFYAGEIPYNFQTISSNVPIEYSSETEAVAPTIDLATLYGQLTTEGSTGAHELQTAFDIAYNQTLASPMLPSPISADNAAHLTHGTYQDSLPIYGSGRSFSSQAFVPTCSATGNSSLDLQTAQSHQHYQWPLNDFSLDEIASANTLQPINLSPYSSSFGDNAGYYENTDLQYYLQQPLTFPGPLEEPWNALGVSDQGHFPRAHRWNEPHIARKTRRTTPPRKQLVPIVPKPTGESGRVFKVSKPVVKGMRNGPLEESARDKARATRGVKACWICALQKDPCQGEETCTRCSLRAHRGQSNLLGCSRTHLLTMVAVFLPGSMKKQHQTSELIAYVERRAVSWSEDSDGIEVYLDTGYGPPFKWLLHEFKPAWPELLSREQRVLDKDGQTFHRTIDRSPPLGVRKLNEEDGARLDYFLDDMITKHLDEFKRECFVDEDPFKTEVTNLLCLLYRNLPCERLHDQLRDDLKQVLRMLAVTLIMDHTINLDKTHRTQILAQLSQEDTNSLGAYSEKVSPWMASMQLKCFFNKIRDKLYTRNLNRLQQILHSSVKSFPRISALILILGLALVLEECQHLLLLQAEGRINRREVDNARIARKEATDQCFEVDQGFEFIRNLFHCRYSSVKNQQRAELDQWLKTSQDSSEKDFLHNLFDLFATNKDYLRGRQDLILDSPDENNHSSRLLARFMLGVMT